MTSSFGTGPQRTLGTLLRRLRKQGGLSGMALAEQLGVSQSHLSRIELGAAAATRALVAGWLDRTGAGDTDRATATGLAENVAAEFGTWREALAGGLVKLQREIGSAEASSRVQRQYLPMAVPGLLQTPEYAHHLVMSEHADRADAAEAVAARVRRQVVLVDDSRTLSWVVGEAGLRWRMGPPSVMAAQLERLVTAVATTRLDLRILPFARTVPLWVPHGFWLLADRADGEPDLVNIELLTGPMNVRDPDQVLRYREAYERLAELAVGGDEAIEFIRGVQAEEYPR